MKTKLLRMLTALSVLRSIIMDWSLQELLNGLASKWYRLFSAERGDAGAQLKLGVMYDQGQGVLQDDKEAIKWYQLAAEQDNPDAQFNLGLMYLRGHGVSQDYDEVIDRIHFFILVRINSKCPGINNRCFWY